VQVNKNFAIDLVHEDPVVVCSQRVVASDSGGPLGHPRVYINLVSCAAVFCYLLVNLDDLMCAGVNVQIRVHVCLMAVVLVKLAWPVASPILRGDWCKNFVTRCCSWCQPGVPGT